MNEEDIKILFTIIYNEGFFRGAQYSTLCPIERQKWVDSEYKTLVLYLKEGKNELL